MKRTPEDFLVCYNVPIARTGTQEYLGSELGLYDRPNDIIKVYREPEEVFSKKTIASFEGKPFVDEHPGDWVTPLNFSTYGKGTVTNVRKGEGKDKDYLLADIVVYNLDQIEEIERKQKREVSCGYECEYVPFKDGYQQKNIVGNHVALVSAGRAGSKVAIRDSAKSIASKHDNKEGVKKMSETGKYRIPVSHRRQKTSDYLKAVGLKQVAIDAEPEDILDAMNELVEEKKEEEKDNEPIIIEREGVEDEDEEKSDEMNEMKESLKEVKITENYKLVYNDQNYSNPSIEQLKASGELQRLMVTKLYNMASMFANCEQIKYVDLQSLDLCSLHDLDNTFEGCSSLITVKFGKVRLSSLVEMEETFLKCKSLIKIDLSDVYAPKLRWLINTFTDVRDLKEVRLPKESNKKLMFGQVFGIQSSAVVSRNRLGLEQVMTQDEWSLQDETDTEIEFIEPIDFYVQSVYDDDVTVGNICSIVFEKISDSRLMVDKVCNRIRTLHLRDKTYEQKDLRKILEDQIHGR